MPVYATGDEHITFPAEPLPLATIAAAVVGSALLAGALARLIRRPGTASG